MTEYIDHAKRVEELVALSRTTPNDEKQWLLAEAQVHATLALAEQQRFANRIAYHVSGMYYGPGAYGKELPESHQELRKGIGL